MTAEVVSTKAGSLIVLPPAFSIQPGEVEIEAVGKDHFFIRRRKEGPAATEADLQRDDSAASVLEVPPDYLPEPVEPLNF